MLFAATLLLTSCPPDDQGSIRAETPDSTATEQRPPSLNEARQRAKVLHELCHATLQIVHRRYYREDEGLPIPARTMESVFKAMHEQFPVTFHWISVNAKPMNVDHEPKSSFEKAAAKALAAGEDHFERIADKRFHYAAPVILANECLKCHSPLRTSNRELAAGLVITMPIADR